MIFSLLRSRTIKQRPRVPEGTRIYAIGDVHGRADLLSEVLAHIDDDLAGQPIGNPIEVLLGDYIDRGPASREVIDLLINRRRQHQMVFLRGNHEDFALRFLGEPGLLSFWENIGGLDTIASYGISPLERDNPRGEMAIAAALHRAMPDNHLKFLQGLALTFTCGDYFFVHAGVRPGIPLQAQSRRDLLSIRNEFLQHTKSFGKMVVHGHTPSVRPEVRSNRINIDTGAYETGRLTCLVLENDEIEFL